MVGLAAFMLAAPSVILADGRVALVIGNSAYTETSRLANPVNDATDMAAALRALQFDVTLETDTDEDALDDALASFEEQSAGADLALVFYAGHGMEMNGANYLVPVDARLASAAAVERETIALDSVLAATSGARTRIVILDACRNNPFARTMRGAQRANVRSGGLAAVSTGAGLLVAYAAAAGDVAADGEEDDRNSPYTAVLLQHLRSPGVEVRVMLGNVGGAVSDATGADQQPFVYTSLTGEHYLAGRVPAPAADTADSLRRQETVFWESIRESTNPADFEAYLNQFSTGVFAQLARNRLTELPAVAGATDPSRPRPGDRPVNLRRRPGTVFRDCDGCPSMIVLPAGAFHMGCVSDTFFCRDEREEALKHPRRNVRSFALSTHEVTRGEYATFVLATGYATTGECATYDREWQVRRWARDRWEWRRQTTDGKSWRTPGFEQGDNHPVVCVSWVDASAYVRWLSDQAEASYRLPSREEWEYAARAGTTTAFYWGDDNDDHCNDANLSDRTKKEYADSLQSECVDGAIWTSPVGSFSPNTFGLYDMVGNVREYVTECAADVRGNSDGCMRSVGASWYTYPLTLVRSVDAAYDFERASDRGFRVARELK